MINQMDEKLFIEVGYKQIYKYNQAICGDCILLHKIKDQKRIICVLSDGLGSGVKANVLATLTATMAYIYTENYNDLKKSAKIIMKTLPICKQRKISYSTFTIIDIDNTNVVRIIEYENPSYIYLKNSNIVNPEKKKIKLSYNKNKENCLLFSKFKLSKGDRIIFFSDGITQAGIGENITPLGWGIENVKRFTMTQINNNFLISAKELSNKIVERAYQFDKSRPKDDISCGVIYAREPRKLLIVTGPPYSKRDDIYITNCIKNFKGKKVICGGTTAKIIARILKRELKVDLDDINYEIPPVSYMEGIDLITEGTITLGKVAEILEKWEDFNYIGNNAVTKLIDLLINSDIIYFIVGTRLNPAHQNPNVPVELGIRRNLVKKIANLLEEKFVKEIFIEFI